MPIRPAILADAAAIARVHVASWRATYPGLILDAVLANLSEERHAAHWEQTLSAPQAPECVFVAEDEAGVIVGFASGGPTRSEDPAYAGELYTLYLLPAAQGQGLGKALLRAVARNLAARAMHSLIVWALKGNPACQFYAAQGGQFVREATFTMGGAELWEVAYGWADTEILVGDS